MADRRVYRPAAIIRLKVRLEDYDQDGEPDQVPSELLPFAERLTLLERQETLVSNSLSEAIGAGDTSAIQGLQSSLLGVRRRISRLRAATAAAKAVDENLGDAFSIDFVTVPINMDVDVSSFRSANTFTATIPYRDVPLDSQMIRACLVEAYLGVVSNEDFATTDRWRLSMDQANIVFRGFADDWNMSQSGDDATISFSARSMESVIIDTQINALSPSYRVKGSGEKISEYVTRVLSSLPSTSGRKGGDQVKAVFFGADANKEPLLDRKALSRVLQTSQSKNKAMAMTGAAGQAATDVSFGGTDQANVAGVGDPRLPVTAAGDLSAWQLIIDACALVGCVPTYDPSAQVGNQTGDFILIRPINTIYPDVKQGYRLQGQLVDFSRTLPNMQKDNRLVPDSNVRIMVWGRNIQTFSSARKLGRIKAPTVEVSSYNPDAPPGQRLLKARYPTTRRATRVDAKGASPAEEVVKRQVNGIRDLNLLKQAAVSLHAAISRPELEVTIETDDLGSYIDPTTPDRHNTFENVDILRLQHGTPLRIGVARQIVNPDDNQFITTPLSDIFEKRPEELYKVLVNQSERFEPSLDSRFRQDKASEMVRRFSNALTNARRTDLFYTRSVKHAWSADGGYMATISVINFLEARVLPSNLSGDDAAADQDLRITQSSGLPTETELATARALNAIGRTG